MESTEVHCQKLKNWYVLSKPMLSYSISTFLVGFVKSFSNIILCIPGVENIFVWWGLQQKIEDNGSIFKYNKCTPICINILNTDGE